MEQRSNVKYMYVYAFYDKINDQFYVGLTNDMKRRSTQHLRGNGHTTSRFKSLQQIFYEWYLSNKDARRREKYLKTSKGKKTLRLMLKESLKEMKSCPVV
ncbi:MAG: GIY-YIG nuclease family protein [Candidatus Omnitrophica bacterium]|nr:GIY-YIG nuclease family protein [Candidatus Omnitrophota bacterium]